MFAMVLLNMSDLVNKIERMLGSTTKITLRGFFNPGEARLCTTTGWHFVLGTTGRTRNSVKFKPHPKILNLGPILLILDSYDNLLREIFDIV
jgi:hypothetical protein